MDQKSFLHKFHDGLEWFASSNLAQFPWVTHAFSTRVGGRSLESGLNLGNAGEAARPSIRRNRRRFFAALQAGSFSLALAHQTHSAEVLYVARRGDKEVEYRPSGYRPGTESQTKEWSADALLTDCPGVLLSIRTADCLPILILDAGARAVAAVHAGWRGALKRLVEKTVGEMRRLFGSQPQQLFAALGPSIRCCCYEVGQEVFDAFCGEFACGEQFFRKVPSGAANSILTPGTTALSIVSPGEGRSGGSGLYLDLTAVAQDQLEKAGVPRAQIQTAPFCTACRTDLFFSYRKEGSATGRMMAVIGIRE